ncbi:retrotransposon-like protein [Gossypium australe]|uniref:Retrotransposon-like protein n=1 Tax=Gossypium australe TaxID=47621 RepID=A0A5B6VC82_9ROSI|nr:retrotransposon-like protein [Gossypium australe]
MRKIPLFVMSAKNQDISSLIVSNERRRDQANKSLSPIWLLGVMRILRLKRSRNAYNELGLEFKVMVSKHKKNISKLKDEKDLLSKTSHELEEKVNKIQEIINDFEKKNLDDKERCFKVDKSSKNLWYIDSGCSRYMIVDEQFYRIKVKSGEVTFGDNSKGLIGGIGFIGKNSSIFIENVLYINSLKHNLSSISQLCDKGVNLIFESNHMKPFNKIELLRGKVGLYKKWLEP